MSLKGLAVCQIPSFFLGYPAVSRPLAAASATRSLGAWASSSAASSACPAKPAAFVSTPLCDGWGSGKSAALACHISPRRAAALVHCLREGA